VSDEPLQQQTETGKTTHDGLFAKTNIVPPAGSGDDPLPADAAAESSGSSAAKNWIGKTLGKYRLDVALGQGGMGVVFRAHDAMIERDVAVKILAKHLTADATALARFLAEARATGKLSHPNVVAIYEICWEENWHFLVMEYLSGGSLADRLEKSGSCSPKEATRMMIDVCQGVAAAHAVGLIHRDIKPANFMQAADGTVKVTDFGLAKNDTDSSRHLTQAGTVIGTPIFMSPEQCQGQKVDARSDIYSLGATYYALLTGKHAYADSPSIPQIMFKHCHAPVPDPRSVDQTIPPACSRIVARSMAKLADERYPSAAAMLSDLRAVWATLSGQIPILLPSESGVMQMPAQNQGQGLAAVVVDSAHGLRSPIAAMAGKAGLLTVIGLALFFGLRWQTAPVLLTSDEPIRVGVLHSTSGSMANSETVVLDATLMAIEEVNRSGGLLNRKIVPVVRDGRSEATVFARQAKTLMDQEKVHVVFGCWTSASRKSVIPVIEAYDNLLVYPLQYEGLETSRNVIYIGAAPNQQIIPAVKWAVETLGKKRFFLVGSDYVFPRVAHEIIKDQLRLLRAETVGEQFVRLGSQEVQSVVEAIVQAKPDIIFNTLNGDTNINFFRQLRAVGVTPQTIPCLSLSIGEQELRSFDLSTMVGDYAAWPYFQCVDTPANRKFGEHCQEKFPSRSITDPMECAYVGVMLWAQAVRQANAVDPTSVRREMLNSKFDAPEGNVRIDPDTQHCYKTPRIGQIRSDGQFQIVWSASEPIKPEPYPSTRTASEWSVFLIDLYRGWDNQWSAPSTNAVIPPEETRN
jgi:urea transport system substrate-binding protein